MTDFVQVPQVVYSPRTCVVGRSEFVDKNDKSISVINNLDETNQRIVSPGKVVTSREGVVCHENSAPWLAQTILQSAGINDGYIVRTQVPLPESTYTPEEHGYVVSGYVINDDRTDEDLLAEIRRDLSVLEARRNKKIEGALTVAEKEMMNKIFDVAQKETDPVT